MGVGDVGVHGLALGADPRRAGVARLVEGDVLAGGVARRGHGQRAQVAFADQAGQAFEPHQFLEQSGQRFVVEQRVRPHLAPAGDRPAERQQGQPVRAAAHHAERIGAVDLFGMEIFPDAGEMPHRVVEMVGTAGQRRGVDGTG